MYICRCFRIINMLQKFKKKKKKIIIKKKEKGLGVDTEDKSQLIKSVFSFEMNYFKNMTKKSQTSTKLQYFLLMFLKTSQTSPAWSLSH